MTHAQDTAVITQDTPSQAQYFSWINNAWEGSNEFQTLTNLAFFKWLHDEYGMRLDLYALDAGNLDTLQGYGSMESKAFKAKFPNGFKPMASLAQSFGCRLGMWLGPDGFGDTPERERARYEMLLSLCRDQKMALLKLDQCASELRPQKQEILRKLLAECRKHVPDLVVLNHRVKMGVAGPQATTSLWEGKETYIDVYSSNHLTAPHHRADALARGIPPKLNRLTEDHGVCISSCLDAWDDDLVLQAFNRCLILAPQIYGNPWLLRDDEFPKLARIYNLHRKYRDILISGIVLPEKEYGQTALSRGDASTRFITLRNLTWEPQTRRIVLDYSIGLTAPGDVEVRQFHPTEKIVGRFPRGSAVEVDVPAFRAVLVMVSTKPIAEVGIAGADYRVVRDVPGKPVEINLLGPPGTQAEISLPPSDRWGKATLGDQDASSLLKGGRVTVRYPGVPLTTPWHRKLGALNPIDLPADAEALFEATCFAADSNSLEVRSLARSGTTRIAPVKAARDALFNDPRAIDYGLWDRYAFDGDPKTAFRTARGNVVNGGAFRVDLGQPIALRELTFRNVGLSPAGSIAAEVSTDLRTWTAVTLERSSNDLRLTLPSSPPVRYVRIAGDMKLVGEIEGFDPTGKPLDRAAWRASNLLGSYKAAPANRAWSLSTVLPQIPRGSFLAIAVNGEHGIEGAYAAARIDGKLVGAPDRAVSFPSNVWESGPSKADRNYTYYIPLTPEMAGEPIDIVLLGVGKSINKLTPEAWITAIDAPLESIPLRLE